MSLKKRLRRVMGDGIAETRPDARDPRFRGRTFAIPFEDVWQASLALLKELPGCKLRLSNDRDGIIIAQATIHFPRHVNDVTISIVLDADAQTRVDMRSVTRDGAVDMGSNAKRVLRFFELLDQRMAALKRRPLPTSATVARR